MKHVVITGGTRGLGYELAREFGRMGWMVSLSGRTAESAGKVVSALEKEHPGRYAGWGMDIAVPGQAEALWVEAVARGTPDVWINNAGVNQERGGYADIDPVAAEAVVATNLFGAMRGTRVAFNGMRQAGAGRIYNMEGFGSNGMMTPGMTVYGTSKAALSYFTRSFAREAKGSGVAVGTLSPGMMMTDFLKGPLEAMSGDERARLVRIYDILADSPEDVARFIVRRIAADRSAVPRIQWLTTPKVLARFLLAPFVRRRIVPDELR